MPQPPTVVTADDLPRLTPPNKLSELVRGVLVVREPPGYRHGQVTFRLAKALSAYVDERGLGEVLAAETGFKLFSDPDTVRAPDVAFVSRARLPDPPPEGFAAMAPDLVVEVLSPGDRPGEVLAKVGDWLSAGSALVWVVDPVHRRARVYRADGSERLVAEDGILDGDNVVPGFSYPLAALF
jgi:Uma2 family endonuclease